MIFLKARLWLARYKADRKKIRGIRRRNKWLSKAIRQANAQTNWDRKTRYVFENGRGFDILSTSDIKAGKILGKFSRNVKINDIYERAVYVASFNPEVKENWKQRRMSFKKKAEKK